MRKSSKLIAGLGVVAGLGVALAPLGVFAATPTRLDNLHITSTEACSINGVEISAANAGDTATASTFTDPVNHYDWAYAPGTEYDFTRRTEGTGTATENTFTIVCNYADGFKIVANAVNPTNATLEHTIAAGTTGPEYWAAKILSTSGGMDTDYTGNTPFAIDTANQKIVFVEGATQATGASFSMGYVAKTAADTPAGTYEGSVSYTLVKGA